MITRTSKTHPEKGAGSTLRLRVHRMVVQGINRALILCAVVVLSISWKECARPDVQCGSTGESKGPT